MIIGHQVGDITHPNNRRDIIIAMNTKLADVTKIGRPFVEGKYLKNGELELGSVLTYNFESSGRRRLHMMICHKLGEGGWDNAPQYLRFGLDHLWFNNRQRRFSVVAIGTGRVGKRDGANVSDINTALATAHLEMTLFIQGEERIAIATALRQIVPSKVWQPSYGSEELQVAA